MRKREHLLYRHTKEDYSEIIKSLFQSNPELVSEKSLYIYSKEMLQNRLQHLTDVYPNDVLHAVAIKTNSLPDVLKLIVANGQGLEAASYEEVILASEAACPNNKIIFDSPAKTQEEIDNCDKHFPGLYLNVNSLKELERTRQTRNLRIGVRINPLVDVKSPGIYNVSNKGSKFGIPITLSETILEAILSTSNVEGLHVHAGSEIGNIKGHVEAIGLIYDFAEKINNQLKDKIKFIDIGGGFPAKMEEGEQESLEPFVKALKVRCPNIFTDYQVITEYGRFVHAHNAFAISRVEYIMDYYDPNIIITHLGADLFVREIYSQNAPYHSKYIFDAKGDIKKEEENQVYDIGGPLCFSGDFLGRGVKLSNATENDLFIIADCGANTISMWSNHCSRKMIKVKII